MSLVEIHVLELPVQVAGRAQQHFEELMREFALIAAGVASDDQEHHVPKRLLDLVDTLVQQYGGLNTEAEQRLADAIDRGDEVIADHVLEVPPEAGAATQALGDIIDEADEYCRRGQHLLTLASPEEAVNYRRWYLSEVIRQLDGQPPVPWPQYTPG
jgi:hypothetical protein